MNQFVTALALAVAIEGLAYSAFPAEMKRMLARLTALPASSIRAAGLTCAGIALVLLWWLKG